jgi:60 kDa SS-A/Ro ribonucleoprotein
MNKDLFSTETRNPNTDTVNEAGGRAYALGPKEALAQLVCTGFLGDTFYTKAEDRFKTLHFAMESCPAEFIAQCAVYARKHGFMKDSPAILVAYLFAKQEHDLLRTVFLRAIDNAKMLSNFVRIVRSGVFGRKSLGTFGKKLIHAWLQQRDFNYLYRSSIALNPSLADIIRLARPRPEVKEGKAIDPMREALYAHLIGKPAQYDQLPPIVRQHLEFAEELKAKPNEITEAPMPDLPFNMLDTLPLATEHWKAIFRNGGYQFTRMNLQTAKRKGLFDSDYMTDVISKRLANAEEVKKARQFPYQIFNAYLAVRDDPEIPRAVKDALHVAVEHSMSNVPELPKNTVVAVDTSGSMGACVNSVGTSNVSCIDVAALFAAAIVKRNPSARVIGFDTAPRWESIEPRDTVFSIARSLGCAGGGTDCGAPLGLLLAEGIAPDLFIMISDNMSWYEGGIYGWVGDRSATNSSRAWNELKKRNPKAKQVRINIQPHCSDQIAERKDTLKIGGFSDAVFGALGNFAENRNWVSLVESVTV